MNVRKVFGHVYERFFMWILSYFEVFGNVYFYERFYFQNYLAINFSSKYI